MSSKNLVVILSRIQRHFRQSRRSEIEETLEARVLALEARRDSEPLWRVVVETVGTVGTVVTAVVAVVISIWVYQDSNVSAGKAQEHILLSKMADMSIDFTRFVEDHPDTARHFSKLCRTDQDTDASLVAEYKGLTPHGKIQIMVGCERIADYIQLTFTQRSLLDPEDWNGWWAYFCDVYDESPALREFLKDRKDWYSFESAITTERRQSFEMETH